MKTIVAIFALIVAVSAAPTQITDNNVGDIINVGIKADLDLVNKIDIDKYSVDVLLRNLQAILLRGGGGGLDLDFDRPAVPPPMPALPKEISPEMIQAFMKSIQNGK